MENLNYKNEPRLLGEVIKDLIQSGEILPNYKHKKNGAQI